MFVGLTSKGATVIDVEDRGEEKVVSLTSSAMTKRAAVRSARLEAADIIPLKDQEVSRVIIDRSLGRFRTRYLVTIAHNPGRGVATVTSGP